LAAGRLGAARRLPPGGSLKKTVYVDTAWLVALIDVRDQHHGRALKLAETLAAEGASLLSTDAVVIELCNYFARSPLRAEAISWVEEIRVADGWEITPVDRRLLSRAERRYRAHADKNWSLTDCIGMDLMLSRRVESAATTDSGFRQAGFRILLTERGR
jgi:predicted nucleic acid-binding protein